MVHIVIKDDKMEGLNFLTSARWLGQCIVEASLTSAGIGETQTVESTIG